MIVTIYKNQLESKYYDIDLIESDKMFLRQQGYLLSTDPEDKLSRYSKPDAISYSSPEYKAWEECYDKGNSFSHADYPVWHSNGKGDVTVILTPEQLSDLCFNKSILLNKELTKQTMKVNHPLEGLFEDLTKIFANNLVKAFNNSKEN